MFKIPQSGIKKAKCTRIPIQNLPHNQDIQLLHKNNCFGVKALSPLGEADHQLSLVRAVRSW